MHWEEEFEAEATQTLIEDIVDLIEERTGEGEGGEPPDQDTIEEALGLSGAYSWDDVVNKAYEVYYRRLK